MSYIEVAQCMFGAPSKKPTGLLVPSDARRLACRCTHSHRHELLLGLDWRGHFKTTPAARYPPALCTALAEVFVERLSIARAHHYFKPYAPRKPTNITLSPWGGRMHGSWSWPQPSANFLIELLERIHGHQIHFGIGKAQQ